MIGIELGTCSWRYYRHHRIEKPMALTRFTEQLRDTQYVEFFFCRVALVAKNRHIIIENMIGIELGTCSWRSNRHHRIETPMALTRLTEQLKDTNLWSFFASAQNKRKHAWHRNRHLCMAI